MANLLRHTLLIGAVPMMAVIATACSDDGSSSMTFCELLAETGQVDVATDASGAVTLMRQLRDKAPEALGEEVRLMADVTKQMSEVDQTDQEAVSEVFALVLDPEVTAASEAVQAYGVEECGLSPDEMGSGGDNLDDLGDAPTSP